MQQSWTSDTYIRCWFSWQSTYSCWFLPL
uniref:Uncharacterized protein n=1 Tax=Arundo donax TaxID=35708 RepID=A0A0A9FXV7_ARUDO